MSDKPLVSVVITNYNYGGFLRAAVQSAIDQSYRPLEVIVVDDGSTDCSRAVLRSFGGQITTILQDNRGQARAFNAGVLAARGELVCLLDADDVWVRDKVEVVVSAYRNDSVLIHH